MPFEPGVSGNPKGRPAKKRALTAILEKAGSKTVEVDGKKVSGKNLVARMMWEIATHGYVEMPGGKMLTADTDDWISVVKWIYAQVDGPPRQDVDVTSDGEKMTFTLNLGDRMDEDSQEDG